MTIYAKYKNNVSTYTNNKNDHHSNRGLLLMVGRRRGMLEYLKKTDIERYRTLIARLNLRK